ncbi:MULTISPECIES: sodium-translocating pyrophosphatase [unclassified Actinobaculum]|uniref:sodium-translocating pyrophosphatase n=1 Tax=unclassified Actinobaculum TaxID=2609299 RepID=UPI000D527FE3|nr:MULTISPECIES: sodium-translocating pyrophosphatase [unclassified Actinobaculum]AWE42684.1 sodium-translocating pyrophosphatase [Actinobaculum sp. 313]RTE49491.1 sodium-translocating pyrophosphatase [Actinobaculum sp. 352]
MSVLPRFNKTKRRTAQTLSFLALLAVLTGCGANSNSPGGGSVGGGEASLVLPDLSAATSAVGIGGRALLYGAIVVCLLGLGFGLVTFFTLRKQAVHKSMLDVAELIYSTCKAYLLRQGRFLLILWVFITAVIVVYYRALVGFGWGRVLIVIGFSLLGMGGSYAVAWFGIRVNTFANARTAFASLRGKPYNVHRIPLSSGMSIGMVLISLELVMMLVILLFLPSDVAGACFIGFAIGESLGASALRIAGGIFTKIADIGADLMKIVFKIDEDDPRNPGVIADCTGDNAGDSVGPSADGFETYGVTGVALVTFILLAVENPALQATLLVWIFTVRAAMILAAWAAYAINGAWVKAKWGNADRMNFETPLSTLVWLTSALCVAFTYGITWVILSDQPGGLWLKLATIITCGTLAGALIPELVKVFTSTNSQHVRETVKSSRQGGASLNILSGVVAGNFSGYWLGITILGLMGGGFLISQAGLSEFMIAPAVFAFGLVAFGFLGMGPVTIAVDSYGPVTDNAQSVYELSRIEEIDGIDEELRRDYGIDPRWERAKLMLEDNDGAGNTFKATAKPVLIGTAVVGATTMIFSIIIGLTDHLTTGLENLSLLHAPFLLGLIAGGAVIFWFSGASIQAVTTGANRAVAFIRDNIHLDASAERASTEDSRRVVDICTQYAQRGMLTIFLAVFFMTLSFAFVEPYFFIGYLISIAIFGLYQAIYMANAGGAWDNAKKVVEVDLHMKGTALHDATIVGDTVGDPFKDTSSVALNPIIKFTTLFGLLAVELAVSLTGQGSATLVHILAAVFFLISAFFVHRSFYGMRIDSSMPQAGDTDDGDAVASVSSGMSDREKL